MKTMMHQLGFTERTGMYAVHQCASMKNAELSIPASASPSCDEAALPATITSSVTS